MNWNLHEVVSLIFPEALAIRGHYVAGIKLGNDKECRVFSYSTR